MRLDVPYRRVAELDTTTLEQIVSQRLAPLFEGQDTPTWRAVAERSRYIDRDERPADVGYRRMRPEGYLQLCVLNDEEPAAPWALPVSEEVLSLSEQQDLATEYRALCKRFYGDGTLYFLGFAVLAPGGRIPPHRDMPHDRNKKSHSHHLHIPITGAADAEFVLHGQPVFLERGGVYEIDNMRRHSVTHRGPGYRVNLMIDYCPAASVRARNAPSRRRIKWRVVRRFLRAWRAIVRLFRGGQSV